MPRLILIDCYSLLFRAYFGGRQYLTTSDGRPTGALFGFTNMLVSLINQEKPDSIYAAWDGPGKTFRDELYADYKAHRPAVADDLRQQFPVARDVVQALGIPSFELKGYEADDLIGTLAEMGVREGYEVIIITGDSDQLQLVGKGVMVRMTRKGVTDMADYDAAAVVERYGIGPKCVADYKALVGDSSDNIPGVPGIGAKTASKLLQEWGSLNNLLEHIPELPAGRMRDSLEKNTEQARMSLQLATIHCEVPFEGPIMPYLPTEEDIEKARHVFADLEFRTMLQRLPQPKVGRTESPSTLQGREKARPSRSLEITTALIETQKQLQDAIQAVRDSGMMAIRLQTDGLSNMLSEIKGIAFASGPDQSWFMRISAQKPLLESEELGGLFAAHPAPSSQPGFHLSELQPVFSDPAIKKIGHNIKPEIIVLSRQGISLDSIYFDSMIAGYLLNPERSGYSLTDLVEEHLGVSGETENEISPEVQLSREAAVLCALYPIMEERLNKDGLQNILHDVEMPLVPILAEMEKTGVPVDKDWLDGLSASMATRIEDLAAKIYVLAGETFTINSPKQLQYILFEKLKLPTGRKIKSGFTTRAELLDALSPDFEIAARILEYRELTKLKSTYADALPRLINIKSGRIHSSLNQTVTTTGRLSSSDPNLQNIPVRSLEGREIRKAFIAPEGQTLLSCDYSQIELRVFAYITRDPKMIQAFAADEDIHAATASRLFNVELDEVTGEMRRRAKTVNFAVIYGQSVFGLAGILGISREEASAFIDNYFAQFPGVQDWKERTLAKARECGFVQTLMGRRRYLPELATGNHNVRQAAERAAVNMPIQGTAADIMKMAMIHVFRHLRSMCYNCTLLLQVHDELIFSIDNDILPVVAGEITYLMENAYKMDVRLRVDSKSGKNWADTTPLPVTAVLKNSA